MKQVFKYRIDGCHVLARYLIAYRGCGSPRFAKIILFDWFSSLFADLGLESCRISRGADPDAAAS